MKTRRKRKKGKFSFLAKFVTVLFVTFIICIMAVIGLVAGSLVGYVVNIELVDVDNLRLNLTSFIYMTDPDTGEAVELEQLYDTENRIWVSGSKIPEYMKNAFVSIEDERFYSHSGFDIKRLAGAAFQYLTKKGKSSYGGSTITQQLIKNLTKDDDYSIQRKIQEVYRAYNLEKQLSKEEILEYYLNTIYLSQRCNGVASAAQVYFGKDVSELSLAECAAIASITKYPTKYDPITNPENNKNRRAVVLKKMHELGYITKQELEAAKAEEIVFKKKPTSAQQGYQSYFVDAAIDQIIEDLTYKYNYTKEFAGKILYNGGLKIYLSIDGDIQSKLDAIYTDESTFQKSSGSVQPQSSMVIMDPYTGLVKALVGGRGAKEGNRTLNRATQTLRQPGSSIKPLSVYSPAVEYGLVTSGSIVNDSPLSIGAWSPKNDDGRFLGKITVAAALRGSRNVPAVKICDYLTPEASFDFLQEHYHISSLVESETRNGKIYTDKGLSQIALGGLTDGVSVLEMCAAYCVFPNGGTYRKPSLYTKILDSNGDILLECDQTGEIAISESTAREMVSMLTNVVTGGTGTAARLSNMPAAGKTGTTSNNKDRWFVGFTPYYVGAVWFGYDQPASLRGFSSNPAAIAWRKVMTEVHKDLGRKEFFYNNESENITVMICSESGMRATPSCKHRGEKVYSKRNVPKSYCNEHKYTFNANKLAGGAVREKPEDKEDKNQSEGNEADISEEKSENESYSSENSETSLQSQPDSTKPVPSQSQQSSQASRSRDESDSQVVEGFAID